MIEMRGQQFFDDPSFPFFIDRYTIKQNEIISPHKHDFVEFVYIVSGNAMHEWMDKNSPLSPGDVFAIEPNTVHGYIGSSDQETIVYNILFHRTLLEREMEALLRFPAFIDFFYLAPFLRNNASFVPYTSLDNYQRLQLESHLRVMHEEFKQHRDGFSIIIKSRWIECLVLLSRYHNENRELLQVPNTPSSYDWITSIVDFVERHCEQELTLISLAETCRMSVSSFTAKFKRATGMSLVEFKHAAQIRRACQALKQSDDKIAIIAMNVGFNDISFFNRIFRKYAGCTPREFRKSSGITHIASSYPPLSNI
ncbi:AraC family transcriptional regulator [Paenibacillus sp. PAMC21692]|uniref:AraC family transcriptional regulator n=1 Tax=Paenibacillus sp. PAMC21692 TaxID=2762320 RepID=UPI00164CF50F|nr:AraC family transcriptional regulator [Paenibacillus sp. PAMC21692]QNK58598.1 helix-turn-helix transcriptional regulator [Paenibacillus sp. PAMC21692]